ncbi:DNA-binding protein [Chryseobacterium sp. Leaf404]|uniref:type II toxin-antitoxin system VapC family toxin n=1 Tax=unclassified Chryseobacterium TaxID=2593645 RepID=UPI0006F39949|nr:MULTISPECIES: PIN domain-containing protein [unclassified Chryseobacterium]KQT15482.1 DNA-binding protein [Chryseobacterium sp. Leaf404]
MENILIDTDVILDFFFDRIPFSEDASKILSKCEKGEVQGFVTAVILSNIYYLLRKTSTHIKVTGSLKSLLTFIHVLPTDKNTVVDALDSEFKDFEDALQNFSAQNADTIKIIITRNIKDYKTSGLSIMTPETFLKSFG